MRLISYAVAGAIAVLLGGRLLSSVTSVVLAWRLGNPLPLIVAAGGTFLLVFFSRGEANTLPLMILNIIAWIASAYMSLVVFFVALPLGLVPGFAAMAVSLFAVGIIKDTRGVGGRIHNMIDHTAILGSSIPLIGKAEIDERGLLTAMSRSRYVGFLLARSEKGKVLRMIRERPLLPVSLSRYEDTDILFVQNDLENASQIEMLLRDAGIEGIERLSAFHAGAVLSLPLFEKREEAASLSDYVFCNDAATVDRLVEIWPRSVSLYPSRDGAIVVSPRDAVPGFESQPIPRGLRSAVVVERDVSLLEIGGNNIASEQNA